MCKQRTLLCDINELMESWPQAGLEVEHRDAVVYISRHCTDDHRAVGDSIGSFIRNNAIDITSMCPTFEFFSLHCMNYFSLKIRQDTP